MGFYWRDRFNRDSGSVWKLVRLDRHRQFTMGSTGDLRPKPAQNKHSQSEQEREIKRFVIPPHTPLFLLFCYPSISFVLSLFVLPTPPSISDAVGLPGFFLRVFCTFLFLFSVFMFSLSPAVFSTTLKMSPSETNIQTVSSRSMFPFFKKYFEMLYTFFKMQNSSTLKAKAEVLQYKQPSVSCSAEK